MRGSGLQNHSPSRQWRPFWSGLRGERSARCHAGPDTLPSLAEVAPLFHFELARARRYDRSLCLLGVSRSAAEEVARAVRLFDVVALAPGGGRAVVLMPETTVEDAAAFVTRVLDRRAQDGSAIASFPVDGLTLDALFACVL